MEGKLIEHLIANKIQVTEDSKICLDDLVKKMSGSKNPMGYINGVAYNKTIIEGKNYITVKDCLTIIEKSRLPAYKRIYNLISIEDKNGPSIIDVENRVFQFEGHKFLSFFIMEKDGDDWEVYLHGSEVAKYLGYADKKQAIREHVDKDNKQAYSVFVVKFSEVLQIPHKNIDSKAWIINLAGFFNLIRGSKKLHAMKIKRWLDNVVQPALVKHGKFVMGQEPPKPADIVIPRFYDNALISAFHDLAVLYIGYIGIHRGEHIFKYGLSRRMFSRDYDEHRKLFDLFEVAHIIKCDNCEEVEKLFEHELKVRNVYRAIPIKGKSQTELFTVNATQTTCAYFIGIMEKLVADHKLPIVVAAETEVTRLSTALESAKELERQREAQKIDKFEMKRLEIIVNESKAELAGAYSDSLKFETNVERAKQRTEQAKRESAVELEKEKRITKIELEREKRITKTEMERERRITRLQVGPIELQLEQVKNIGHAIQQGTLDKLLEVMNQLTKTTPLMIAPATEAPAHKASTKTRSKTSSKTGSKTSSKTGSKSKSRK